MKVICYGSRFYGGQVDRIEKGFVELGHEIVNEISHADLVYSNDPGGYKEVLSLKYADKVKGKIVFNVLDIPEHNLPNFDLEGLELMLNHAHEVTCISKFVQDQLIRHLGQKSTVIYNPIKPVTYQPELTEKGRLLRFASVGRRFDPNKRFGLGVAALELLGIDYNRLALVGNDYVAWGHYFGVLNDESLNTMYNNVDFVLALGRVEGLNLPVLEAMSAGCIPVVINDMTTRNELLPSKEFPEYDEVLPNPISVSKFISKYLQNNDAMNGMKTRLRNFFINEGWVDKVSNKGVAQAIIDTIKNG